MVELSSKFGADPGQSGGLSGRPLWPIARDRIRVVLDAAGPLPVIGVGGVERADQVRELLGMGCAAVQLYTALVYEGPGLVRRLHTGLNTLLERDGLRSVSEAVGADA